jgi:hypothetical protein
MVPFGQCWGQGDSKMTDKLGYSSVAALIMARAQKRLAVNISQHLINFRQGP